MRQGGMSVSGLSITFALLLALWEVYFFGFAGEHLLGRLDGTVGFFTPERLGFNMAWLAWGYLSFQLISIPFALPTARTRFVGVVDGMASLIPLAVVLVVVFGKSNLLGTPQRWEAAILLILVTATDLFGGYAFNIALSRRMFDVGGAQPSA
ncbi:MAG TPA: hypothetical protein VH249_02855 [Xanthobacteraceae bacterium]|nr:hypothetical protein [Xanthobacteraceae bacterium]